MTASCKKCLLSTREKVDIDADRLCDYCSGRKRDEWESRFGVTKEVKIEKAKELDRLFHSNKGKSKYDCLLAYSGGKDSTYLLYHLTKERSLKVLAVHVNSPFESATAKKNIEDIRNKMDFDLKKISPSEEFYYRFYKKLFNNPVREGYLKTICYICGPLIIGYCLKTATELKIPLVILGLSPNQPENMFFEWDRSIIEKDWIPTLFKTNEFDEGFLSNFWNPHKYPKNTLLPRAIAPLHVLEYNAENIIDLLNKRKIMSKKRSNPVSTNCDLNWPVIYLDTKLLGYNPYIKEFSAQVRRGENSRIYYKILFWIINILVKKNLFKRDILKKVQRQLGIDLNECQTNIGMITSKFEEYP